MNNRQPLTAVAIRRILIRWKNWGLGIGGSVLLVGFIISSLRPLAYKAEIIVEKKNEKYSPILSEDEYNVTRLTSESQRLTSLLKSRYLMEKWMEAMKITPESDLRKEKTVLKLTKSLSVRPVNFTNLFIVQVKGSTPVEAIERAEYLTQVYIAWDLAQGRQRAEQLLSLLNGQVIQMQNELQGLRKELVRERSNSDVGFSGSVRAQQLESELASKEKLREELVLELERAQRATVSDALRSIQVVMPAVASARPVTPRWVYFGISLFLAFVLGLFSIVLLESSDVYIRRVGDMTPVPGDRKVYVVPTSDVQAEQKLVQESLTPLADFIQTQIKSGQGSVFQIMELDPLPGDLDLAEALVEALKGKGLRTCILTIEDKSRANDEIQALRHQYDVIITQVAGDGDLVMKSAPLEQADGVCLVASSGRTTRSDFRFVANELNAKSNRSLFFVLNQYRDPIRK